ncbi:electron transport complex protein RnfD [Paucidesulfovibrio gracilis DSM 16080]|uniref:Electron transport complex protein RnfD n=1 Tax=Paucidesulfovibrio gracilis DSM 16080 TaxID=1121449 RepID=A0A1T4XB21_9BACT|nr:RnfABCDGE type electron transport complex subunit D [Paucidesulfovibrio gracilis]SKA86703.1 electron transport complex protein RnfD [Paucidesulfovibrio gracilis DSM 16080]
MRPPSPLLTVSCPPHIHCGRTTRGIMLETLLALLPAVVMAVVNYGLPALRVMALCAAAAVVVEALCARIMERENETDDLHALLTGLLLAFLLPASAPWWLVLAGAAASIVLGKAVFGGIGASPLAAPCVGWAILSISWPELMNTELTLLDSNFLAPLHELKHFGYLAVEDVPLMDLLLGHEIGGLGAVQTLPVLAGGLWLLARNRIKPLIPLGFVLGVTLTALCFQLINPEEYAGPVFHLLAGSTLFAAFFLTTDNGSSPVFPIGTLLFGLLAGCLLIIIRVWGVHPDGAAFAILLANLAAPLLDRIRPKPLIVHEGAY